MGGKKKVTMFTMNKYITPHMIEKLDKSAYVHEKEASSGDESSEEEENSKSEPETEEESD